MRVGECLGGCESRAYVCLLLQVCVSGLIFLYFCVCMCVCACLILFNYASRVQSCEDTTNFIIN